MALRAGLTSSFAPYGRSGRVTDAPLSEILIESLEKYYWPSLRNTAVPLDGHKNITNGRTDRQGVSKSRIDGFCLIYTFLLLGVRGRMKTKLVCMKSQILIKRKQIMRYIYLGVTAVSGTRDAFTV